jgi:recombination protein RecT
MAQVVPRRITQTKRPFKIPQSRWGCSESKTKKRQSVRNQIQITMAKENEKTEASGQTQGALNLNEGKQATGTTAVATTEQPGATVPAAPKQKAVTPKEIVYECEQKFNEIVKASGLELSFLKESGFALQAISNNPQIMKCDKASLQQAIVTIALTGLTLNPKLQYCALVPRAGKVVLDIQYQGLHFIMTNQLNAKAIHADVVYKNDEFDFFIDQTGTVLKHKPNKFIDRGERLGVYAAVYLQNGQCVAVVLNEKEVKDIKATSQAAGSSYSPWSGAETIENEMWKKTAIRRLWKMMPKTPRMDEVANSINVDDENFESVFKKKRTIKNNGNQNQAIILP